MFYTVSVADHPVKLPPSESLACPDTHWPKTAKVHEKYLQHMSPEDRTKVLRTNAEQIFHVGLADASG